MRARALLAAGVALLLSACGGGVTPKPDMVTIKATSFIMGTDAPDFMAGRPMHKVTLKAFAIGRYAVTFDDYDAFARETGRPLPDDAGFGRGRHPVINVDWDDVQSYIGWLNAKTGRHFRLPSEAEREYASSGGTRTAFPWGDELDPSRLNVSIDKGKDIYPNTAPVGSFPANQFGLYDMAGNVFERVQDCRHYNYAGAPTDGSAWIFTPCDDRVIRGGSFYSLGRVSRSQSRAAAPESFKSVALGFRLAEDL